MLTLLSARSPGDMDSVGGAKLGGGSDKFVADVEGTVFVTVGTVADEDPFSIGTEYPFSYTVGEQKLKDLHK